MPESNKQQRENLEGKKGIMPIDNRASAGDGPLPMMGGGSFMSKHSQSRMMSSGKPAAMNLMEKGKAVSSAQGSSNYMKSTSPGDEPTMQKYGGNKGDESRSKRDY